MGCLEVPRLSDYFDRCLNVWQSLIHPPFSPLCPNWVKDNERAGHTIGWNLGLLGFACSSTACCSIISPPEPNPPAPPHPLSPSSPYNTNTPDDTHYTIHTSHDSNHLCAPLSKHLKGRLGPRVSNVTFFNHGGRLGPRVSNVTFFNRGGRLAPRFSNITFFNHGGRLGPCVSDVKFFGSKEFL